VELNRAEERCTLPSNIGLEKATNPFLRTGVSRIWALLEDRSNVTVDSSLACMVALRSWKDVF
jgi:hydroxyacylglutathione hydrolase